MDFFKSVFSDDPEPSSPQKFQKFPSGSPKIQSEAKEEEESEQKEVDLDQEVEHENPSLTSNFSGGGWGFGGFIKTFATKSESVLQIYKRDLEEFSSGLKKETAAIREVAGRAVKELPISLESGASVAQESLESVGQVVDDFGNSVWRGTSAIISEGKETLLAADEDSDSSDAQNVSSSKLKSKPYSRFDAQVLALQSDPNSFCEDPEDSDEFKRWKEGFSLEEKGEEVMNLCVENLAVEGNFSKLVPNVVDHETFWTRYFYRIYKLKQAEDARANLVKRAISQEDDEELSWEVDDDDEEVTNVSKSKEVKKEDNEEVSGPFEEKKPVQEVAVESAEVIEESGEQNSSGKPSDNVSVAEPVSSKQSDEKVQENVAEPHTGESVAKSDEEKADPGESSKDSDFSVVSSQPSVQEDVDVGWDEIEDLGSGDERKLTVEGSPNRIDLRKRLSAAEEDEDLSWDIEDDEPVTK